MNVVKFVPFVIAAVAGSIKSGGSKDDPKKMCEHAAGEGNIV